jgi:magnesium transporter
VQDNLKQVESLLRKHALLEEVIHRQELPRKDRHALVDTLVHKQHLFFIFLGLATIFLV